MENRYFTITSTSINEEDRTVQAVVSSERIDADGEIVIAKGCDLSRYIENPVLLWAHNPSIVPIGRATDVTIKESSIEATFQFNTTETGENCWKAYREGGLRAFSIGFMPIETHVERIGEKDILIFDKWQLLEISSVSIQSNPLALAKSTSPTFVKEVLKGDDRPEAKSLLADLRIEENFKRIRCATEDLSNWKRHCEKNGKEFTGVSENIELAIKNLQGLLGDQSDSQSAGGVPAVAPKPQTDGLDKALEEWTHKFTVKHRDLIGRV